MKTIAVIAGSLRQFESFCDDLRREYQNCKLSNATLEVGDKRYMYISRPEQLRGLRNYEIERYGLWYERRDINEITDLLEWAIAAGDATDAK